MRGLRNDDDDDGDGDDMAYPPYIYEKPNLKSISRHSHGHSHAQTHFFSGI